MARRRAGARALVVGGSGRCSRWRRTLAVASRCGRRASIMVLTNDRGGGRELLTCRASTRSQTRRPPDGGFTKGRHERRWRGSPQTLVGGAALVADGAVASGERRCGEEIYQCGGVASAEVDARGSEASQSWGSCPATVGGRCGRSECTQSPLCAQAERRKDNDGGDRIRRCRRRWWHWWMLLRCSQRELAWTSTAVGGRSCGGGMSVQRGRRCTER